MIQVLRLGGFVFRVSPWLTGVTPDCLSGTEASSQEVSVDYLWTFRADKRFAETAVTWALDETDTGPVRLLAATGLADYKCGCWKWLCCVPTQALTVETWP